MTVDHWRETINLGRTHGDILGQANSSLDGDIIYNYHAPVHVVEYTRET